MLSAKEVKMATTIFCFLMGAIMSAINILFIAQDPTRWWNWASAVVCFGLGILCAIEADNKLIQWALKKMRH
jgi:hypothetical protein